MPTIIPPTESDICGVGATPTKTAARESFRQWIRAYLNLFGTSGTTDGALTTLGGDTVGINVFKATDTTESATALGLNASSGSSLVGFIQTGTGAVPRTLQDKGRESVSVKDFGAVGDGVTDDTAAIQAADTYAASVGKGIYLPGAVYVCEGLIVTSVAVVSNGDATLLHKAGSGGTMMSVSSSAVIRGLVFDGNKSNKSGLPYCIVLNSPDCLVTENKFKDHYYKVIVADLAQGSRIISNRFEDNGSIANCNQIEVKCSNAVVMANTMENIGDGHCVRTGYFSGDTVREVSNVVIIGNTFEASDHVGVTCELGSSEILIQGNTFDALEAGVKAETSPDSSDISVIGNTFSNLTNAVGTCFNMSGDRSVFSGNTVINCPSGPFFGSDSICIGNKFINSGTAAAYMVSLANTSMNGITCTDNLFTGTTGGGINIGNGSIIRGNRIKTTSEFAIRAYGVGCIVSENYIDGATTGISVPSTFSLGTISVNYIANCSTTNLSYSAGANTNVVSNNTAVAALVTSRTIATGVVTVGQFDLSLKLDTEASAATDDLDTISGGVTGQRLICTTTSATRDVTLKDGIGNLRLNGDFVIGATSDTISLYYNGTNWLEVARSTNL
jgi:hypothetical protein